MNSMGIVHGDIKPTNMIYYISEDNIGKCILIDMGLTNKCIINNNTYYTKGVAYTGNFRDPEYVEDQYNDIKVEIYALEATYKYILKQTYPKFGDIIGLISGILLLDLFFNQVNKLICDRTSIQELLNNLSTNLTSNESSMNLIPQNRKYTGYYFAHIFETKYNKHNENYIHLLMCWLIELFILFDIKAETGFLCLDLIYKSFDVITGYNKSYYQIHSCVCFNLACIATKENSFTTDEFKRISKNTNDDYDDLFEIITIETLKYLNCVILTTTFWDYSSSLDDLKMLIFDIINLNFKDVKIRNINPGSNKCVTFKQI